jgi:hypothetical protein
MMKKKQIYRYSFLTCYGLNEEDATLIINTKGLENANSWEDESISGLSQYKQCINFHTQDYSLYKLQMQTQRIKELQLVMYREGYIEGFSIFHHLTCLFMEMMDLYLARCFNPKYIVRE